MRSRSWRWLRLRVISLLSRDSWLARSLKAARDTPAIASPEVDQED